MSVKCTQANATGIFNNAKAVQFKVTRKGDTAAPTASSTGVASVVSSAPVTASVTAASATAVNAKAKERETVIAVLERIKTAAINAKLQEDLVAFNKLIDEYNIALRALKADADVLPSIDIAVISVPTAVKASAAAIEASAAAAMVTATSVPAAASVSAPAAALATKQIKEQVAAAATKAIGIADEILAEGYFNKTLTISKTKKIFLNEVRARLTTEINTLIGICNNTLIKAKFQTQITGLQGIPPTIQPITKASGDLKAGNLAGTGEILATTTAATTLKTIATQINQQAKAMGGGKRHGKRSKTHKKHGKRHSNRSKTHKKHGKRSMKRSRKHRCM